MQMSHIQIAPNDEFKTDIDLPGITESPGDYYSQDHKNDNEALREPGPSGEQILAATSVYAYSYKQYLIYFLFYSIFA
jgi:hypothetical protein